MTKSLVKQVCKLLFESSIGVPVLPPWTLQPRQAKWTLRKPAVQAILSLSITLPNSGPLCDLCSSVTICSLLFWSLDDHLMHPSPSPSPCSRTFYIVFERPQSLRCIAFHFRERDITMSRCKVGSDNLVQMALLPRRSIQRLCGMGTINI